MSQRTQSPGASGLPAPAIPSSGEETRARWRADSRRGNVAASTGAVVVYLMLAVAVLCVVLGAVHTGAMGATAIALRARHTTIQLGFGPRLLETEIAGHKLRLALVPWGGFVRLPTPEDEEPSPWTISEWHPFFMVTVSLSGLLALAGVSIATLGVEQFGTHLFHSPEHLVLGALRPTTVGASLARAAISLAPPELLGVLAAKLIVFNCLPFPGFQGPAIAGYLIQGFRSKSAGALRTPPGWVLGITFVLMLAMGGAWLVAIYCA